MQQQLKICSSPGPFAYDAMESVKTLGKNKNSINYDVTMADNHFHLMIDRFVKRKQKPQRIGRRKIVQAS